MKERFMMRKVLFAMVLMAVLPMTAQAEDGPKQIVEKAVNGVVQVLKAREHPDKLTSEDREAIRKAVEGYFDFREMAKRSLGRPWRDLDEQQRSEFVEVFRELLERSYGNRLSEYHNQTIKYGHVLVRGARAAVDSEVIDADKKTPVRYYLHHADEGWFVYDIKIEGISLVSTFRTDFAGIVDKKGFNGLMGSLKERVQNLRKQDQNQKG